MKAEHLLLPLERPWREACRIYGERLLTLASLPALVFTATILTLSLIRIASTGLMSMAPVFYALASAAALGTLASVFFGSVARQIFPLFHQRKGTTGAGTELPPAALESITASTAASAVSTPQPVGSATELNADPMTRSELEEYVRQAVAMMHATDSPRGTVEGGSTVFVSAAATTPPSLLDLADRNLIERISSIAGGVEPQVTPALRGYTLVPVGSSRIGIEPITMNDLISSDISLRTCQAQPQTYAQAAANALVSGYWQAAENNMLRHMGTLQAVIWVPHHLLKMGEE